MSAPQFTPGPWNVQNDGQIWSDDHPVAEKITTGPWGDEGYNILTGEHMLVHHWGTVATEEAKANARLIAAAPDHALICWAMCVQDATWEEWVPFDGSGEFVFAGLRHATRLDEFGCPKLTPALREAITQSRQVPA